MTELQLQAIVNQQGIEGTGESNLDMTVVNGVSVSKWHLDSVTYGKKVSDTLKESVKKYLQQFVGSERVFPTQNGAPRIMTEFLNKPYRFELRDEYTKGPNPRPLPTIKASYYHGKPATQKVLEHFCRSTPVVSSCDNPRCLSRLVIVPKRDPGAPKTSEPTSYRVTMNALINACLKPTPSTLPLATNEIKKLHHWNFYLKADAANAFWSIPLDDESRRMTAFQTHEGIFAWDRLTMGTRPASTVQQSAYYRAMDTYLPAKWRHRFASYADDIAAGADTLEELFELLKALIECFDKAGIQVKASKLIFGVSEISFHNYTISKEQTRPKDENLCPIRNMSTPRSVTELKAFLGCTQQMSQYCRYYGIVASPLHRLTRVTEPFPKQWLPGTDYDIAFHRIKSMMLDESLFLWNKDSNKRLYIEVDACNEGWGACAYQYAEPKPPDVEDEGRYMLMSKLPKRVVEWVSKAWTEFEKELPVFYREALARLLCLEHFRNLIETQSLDAGTTVYTDHAPSTYVGSLSNKGRLSTWRIHETSDLTGIVQTLYKAGQYLGPGPYGGLADPLSRMPRGEQFHRLELPALLTELLQRLPDSIRNAHNIRVTAEKDTHLATRIVQRWRVPKNPISNVRSDNKEDFDFLIAAPFAEKVTHKVAQLIRERKKFAVLIAVDLLPQIKVTKAKENDKVVEQALLSMPTILIAPLALVWLVNHPDYQLPKQGHVVLYGTNDRVLTEASTENGSTGSDVEMTENPDHPENNLFSSSNSDWSKQLFSENSRDDWSRAVVDGIDRLCCDGGLRDPEGSRTLVATTRSRARAPAETPTEVGVVAEVETPLASVSSDVPQRAAKVRTKACVRGKEASEVATFRGSPPPDPHDKWIGQQDPTEIPNGGRLLDSPSGFPDGLLVIEDDQRRQRIIVPLEQRERLIKQEHLSLLHIGPERVARALTKRYYWHKMNDLVKRIVTSCHDCQVSRMRLQRLSLEFAEADANQLPLPRQRYGIDFHGHAKGEILVAIDLVTREVCLWLLPNRKQENVSRALLSGLVFVKGVPLEFRSDNAPELMSGLVSAMNHYLGVEQITTGGYNPRGNAIVERFMHTLGHMLRIASNEEYNNLKDYLQCIAFAHNCTYSSVIECTPFEAGHGLRARTVAEARMALPKLQLLEEDSEDSPATQAWDKSLPKKVLELAARMAAIAQAHSEWHRRMTSEKLNQANRPFDDSQLQVGMRVYFYKPPSQQEVAAKGRKAKHLAHYHGPATVTVSRKRQLELRYEGKTFNRDISLVIPAKDFTDLEVDSFDPVVTEAVSPPSRHVVGELPKEGELVVIKDSTTEGWFLSEVLRVLPNLVEVRYFTTPTPALENYEHCSVQKRSERLSEICFRRTWHVRFGKHVGRATYKPPYPNNEDLQVWKGAINNSDLDSMLLLRNVRIDAEGKLDEASLRLAAQLPISHEKLDTIEDEIEGSSLTRQTPNLFTSSREILCSCVNCSNLLSRDYVVAQRKLTEQSTATSQSSND